MLWNILKQMEGEYFLPVASERRDAGLAAAGATRAAPRLARQAFASDLGLVQRRHLTGYMVKYTNQTQVPQL